MKAIIIAAGKATRLLPLTKETPQCLLEVNGKPIIEHQLDYLKAAGVDDVVVVCGHQADKVETFCMNRGIKTILNPFYDKSGMAMSLWCARAEMSDGILFLYSDILFESLIVKGLVASSGDILLAVKRDGLRSEAEKVIEEGGRIKHITKTDMEGENAEFVGFARFSRKGARELISVLDRIARTDLSASFIKAIEMLLESGVKVGIHDIGESTFVDIDFPEDLELAASHLDRKT